jgi:hypothetical protein
MVLRLFCLFCRICCAVSTGFELLGTARISRLLAGTFLRTNEMLADIEEVGHNRPFLLLTAPEVIKERAIIQTIFLSTLVPPG